MKKVVAVIGTAQKKATYRAVQEFEKDLKAYGEVDFEYVLLHEYNLEFCRGCKLCLDKGEEYCPCGTTGTHFWQKWRRRTAWFLQRQTIRSRFPHA